MPPAPRAKKKEGPRILFVGGTLAARGKLFAPYAADWVH